MQTTELEIKHIQPRPGNRQHGGIDEEKIQELAQSIKDQGLLNPILVRRIHAGLKFELIAGERRFRAATLAGLERIPAQIAPDDASEEWIELAAISENVQRADIHPMDESNAYQRLLELDLTRTAIATAVGRPPKHVGGRIKLQRLIEPLRKLWLDPNAGRGLGGVGMWETLARATEPIQQQALKKITNNSGGSWEFRNASAVDSWIVGRSDKLCDAPFDTNDPELLPAAGACSACPKRMEMDPQLNIFDGESGQWKAHPDDDGVRCGDRRCWKRKVKANFQNVVDELTDSGESFAVATQAQTVPKEGDERLRSDQWKQVDDSEAGKPAVKKIVMENGTVVHGRITRKKTTIQPPHDWEAERARQEEDRKKDQLARKASHDAFNRFADAFTVEHAREVLADPESVRAIAHGYLARHTAHGRIGAYLGIETAMDYGWGHEVSIATQKALAEADLDEALRLLVLGWIAGFRDQKERHGVFENLGVKMAKARPEPAADEKPAEPAEEQSA